MKLIVISQPEAREQEALLCNRLFEAGLETLHLRKPELPLPRYRRLLQQIDEAFHPRIMLHQHHELAQEFNVSGLHFPEALRPAADAVPKGNLKFSTSFHTLEDLLQPQSLFDYAFLSPIFNSISKPGYFAGFSEKQLKNALVNAPLPVIALGGITAETIKKAVGMGFAGAAVLGAVWQAEEPVEAFRELRIKS